MFLGQNQPKEIWKATPLHFMLCLSTSQFVTQIRRKQLHQFLNSSTPDIHEPEMVHYLVCPVNHNILQAQKKMLIAQTAIPADVIPWGKFFWTAWHNHFNNILSISRCHGLTLPGFNNMADNQFFQWLIKESQWSESQCHMPGQGIKGVTHILLLGYTQHLALAQMFAISLTFSTCCTKTDALDQSRGM
jgi:hypothetical protein